MQAEIKVDHAGVINLLANLKAKAGNLRPHLDYIGERIRSSVMENFEQGGRFSAVGDWRGGANKWAPLAQSTILQRTLRGHWGDDAKTLVDSGHMRNSISPVVTGDSVAIGTSVEYAKYHQFGTGPYKIFPKNKKALYWPEAAHPVKFVNHPGIPARPFLVVQDEDLVAIEANLMKHLGLTSP
jgi:phage gpG-like protein